MPKFWYFSNKVTVKFLIFLCKIFSKTVHISKFVQKIRRPKNFHVFNVYFLMRNICNTFIQCVELTAIFFYSMSSITITCTSLSSVPAADGCGAACCSFSIFISAEFEWWRFRCCWREFKVLLAQDPSRFRVAMSLLANDELHSSLCS